MYGHIEACELEINLLNTDYFKPVQDVTEVIFMINLYQGITLFLETARTLLFRGIKSTTLRAY
jgi:hypothetical protein